MKIEVYENISDKEINAVRTTKDGEKFRLNHSEELVKDMKYKGPKKSNTNSQGWERNPNYYFKQLLKDHPEYFNKKNKYRIEHNKVPRVNSKWIEHFPEHKDFDGQQLIHHHIGGDGQAVALPKGLHKGNGGIHVDERKLGITANAKEYSSLCADITKNHPEMEGKTSKEFRQYIKDNKIIAKEGQGVTSKPYEPISDKNSRANDKRIRPQIQAQEQHAKQTINMRRGRTIS